MVKTKYRQKEEMVNHQHLALDGKGPVLRDQALPGQGAGALEELLKAQRLKAPQLQQHALADAQVDVGAGHRLRAAAGPSGACR